MGKIFILLLLSIGLLMGSDKVSTYEEALILAVEKKKPIMLVLVSDYCSWCNRFKNVTLRDAEIKKRLDKEVILLILNKYDGQYPKHFKTSMVPSTVFIDSTTQEEILTQVGFANKENFNVILDDVKDFHE